MAVVPRSTDPITITSTANPRIRAAVALRERRDRERTGLTLVDGIREVDRALTAGVETVDVFMSEALTSSDQGEALAHRLARMRIPTQPVSDAVLARIAFGDRSDGIVSVIRTPSTALSDLDLPTNPLVVVVERVEKPGNLGAIIRTADGAGVDALIVADAGTDLFNPNTIRASLGAVFAIPLAAASTAAAMTWLLERRLRIVTAQVDAVTLYTDEDLTGPVAVVLGSEADGLTDAWSSAGASAVRLPMLGISDSLNVSVAAAVILYEARRQRGTGNRP
jgi:RNA methyltransferase, TrmH family